MRISCADRTRFDGALAGCNDAQCRALRAIRDRRGQRDATRHGVCRSIAERRSNRAMDSTSVLTDPELPVLAHPCVRIQEVIRRHHGALIKFLRRRLSVAEDAEDVAQETYIRMMRYEGSSELKSPSAMLFRIAVNVANDYGRAALARQKKHHTRIEDVELTSELPSAEREVLASQTLDLLLETIEQLPPKCKQVFLLSRASDMTYTEIAAHCGISVKMVEKHVSRAIAACLEKVGPPM
jgi:RNA polymerase sigma factor (sigma-70 family)